MGGILDETLRLFSTVQILSIGDKLFLRFSLLTLNFFLKKSAATGSPPPR